ncbi:MAG: methyltransferase, partial [Candidatus Nanohaloarchaea archaeon]|nr:methyltransferase [Candidatus Nanohaloarchaea archaeon]
MPVDLETDGRDYTVYLELMADDAVIDQKQQDIQPFIKEGTIVEDGCGNGALLERIAHAYPGSDCHGYEIAASMLDRLQEREEENISPENVTYSEQDITEEYEDIQDPDTIIASLICHEIASYGDGEQELEDYLAQKAGAMEEDGRLIIRDVIGPATETTWAWFNDRDGRNPDRFVDLDDEEALDQLSTRARFGQFINDFAYTDIEAGHPEEAYRAVTKDQKEVEGRTYHRMDARIAAEYSLTKDYTDNWENEMEETFCFWSCEDYQEALEEAGFNVIHAETYTSDWIAEHRFEDRLAFRDDLDSPPYFPDTNI